MWGFTFATLPYDAILSVQILLLMSVQRLLLSVQVRTLALDDEISSVQILILSVQTPELGRAVGRRREAGHQFGVEVCLLRSVFVHLRLVSLHLRLASLQLRDEYQLREALLYT